MPLSHGLPWHTQSVQPQRSIVILLEDDDGFKRALSGPLKYQQQCIRCRGSAGVAINSCGIPLAGYAMPIFENRASKTALQRRRHHNPPTALRES